MNKGQYVMRLNRETIIGSLNKIIFCNAIHLISHQLYSVPVPHMLDHRIGMSDVELLVLNGVHITCIRYQRREIYIRNNNFFKDFILLDIDQCNVKGNARKLLKREDAPIEIITPNITDAYLLFLFCIDNFLNKTQKVFYSFLPQS